jgi:spore coat protein U-like protein
MVWKWILRIFFYLMAASAFSATSTTTFTVTATISAACTVSASTLGFGTYNPTLGANLDATTTVNVTCTNGSTYNVGLDAGAGTGATIANRLMTRTAGGTDTIAYSLYQDAGHTTVWGNTIGTNTVSATGSGISQPITVNGRIFSSNVTTIPPASYLDTITVTVTF